MFVKHAVIAAQNPPSKFCDPLGQRSIFLKKQRLHTPGDYCGNPVEKFEKSVDRCGNRFLSY
jgi:hypothetical protein